MVEIRSRIRLEKWLKKHGRADFAQVIATRAALRALLYAFGEQIDQKWVKDFGSPLIRASAISWAARNFPAHDMVAAAYAARAAAYAAADAAAYAADAAAYAARAAAYAADAAAYAARAAAYAAADAAYAVHAAFWDNINHDCNWLAGEADPATASRRLTHVKLWLSGEPKGWGASWDYATTRLRGLDQGYDVWIDWYNRRIKGERAAFDIPGDKRRVEDKKILAALADATDENFWGKGATHVNATLKGWIEEARARVAPPPPPTAQTIAVPPQETGAIAYGVNTQGKIDRLPHSDQARLRNTPDQRRAYDDLRQAALDLREEGQRLGDRLRRVLDRFITSLPEQFEDAETNPIWSNATALRSLNYAHKQAAKPPEPDDARLDGVVAAYLDGLLKHYNVFTFGDNGLRAKDEQSISAQERAKATEELKVGAPISVAMRDNPHILSDSALTDLEARQQDQDLPSTEPYDDQILDDANRSMRNMVAGLISDSWTAFKNANPLVQGVTINAAWDGIKLVATMVGGVEYAPIFNFIAINASILQDYVIVAYPHYDHLPSLIERIKAVWQKFKVTR